jgi:hypothetical protein
MRSSGPTEAEWAAIDRLADLGAEFEVEEEARWRRRCRPLSRRAIRRVTPAIRRAARASDDLDLRFDVEYAAVFLQWAAASQNGHAGSARQRRVIFKRLVAAELGPRVRFIAWRLLELPNDELRVVARFFARLLDQLDRPVIDRRVPRRDNGPPARRHVATPVVANAPPARLPVAHRYAEERAA